MDKQRLLQLAGIITEARYAGSGYSDIYVVVEFTEDDIEVTGPFNGAGQEKEYCEALIEEHSLDDDTLRVVKVRDPEL